MLRNASKKQVLKTIVKKDATLGRKYYTTYKDIKKYFKLMNAGIFNNELCPFSEVNIKDLTRQKCIGQVIHYTWKRKGTAQFHLEMKPTYSSKKEFLDTLAHEMIHLYQMSVLKDTGNHNKTFYSFRPKLIQVGLDI
tara:strand:- start:322 stop:732 length:411 start_codon:yes stop_codon:yes gene_type:complete